MYFYLYLFMDLFSRQIVGWQVYDCESAALASELLQAICDRQGITRNELTVHSDNGSPMKGETMHRHDAALGCGRLSQQASGQQRQPVLGSALSGR